MHLLTFCGGSRYKLIHLRLCDDIHYERTWSDIYRLLPLPLTIIRLNYQLQAAVVSIMKLF